MNNITATSKLVNEKFEVWVLPLQFSHSISDLHKINITKLVEFIKCLVTLWARVMWARPDLLYFTLSPVGYSFYRDLAFIAIMKLFRIPRIFHLHGKGVLQQSCGGLKKHLYRWAFKDAFVIHLSPLLYQDIAEVAPLNRCYFLANGVKLPDYHSDIETLPIDHAPIRFLFLSNMVLSKGPVVLLNALALLMKRGIKFEATFAGEKSTPESMQAFEKGIRENKLEDYVQYLGPKYGIEKASLFRNSDIFVFPSFNECFPLVLLEAMAYGLPVVSTFEGAIPEIVEDGVTGLLTRQQDIQDLADKLERLALDAELRQRMGSAGKRRFETRFTLEQYEANLVKILEQCISAGNVVPVTGADAATTQSIRNEPEVVHAKVKVQ